MTVIETARFLLKKYTSGGDPHPTRAEHNAMIDVIENNAAMYSQGITAARPAAGKPGREYWDTEAKRKYYDDGTAWQDQNPNGGGGAGAKVTPNVNGIEGVSLRAARADHTHRLDLATSAAHGAMSSTDKQLLDGASYTATGNSLVRRDGNGRIAVSTPVNAAEAATKAYVDGLITETADYVDAQNADGQSPTILAPLPIFGYAVSGIVAVERLGTHNRITVNINVVKTGADDTITSTIPFKTLGTVIPAGARGTSVDKYLPVSISGGANNVHATVYLNASSGLLQIRSQAAFTIQNGATFTLSDSYLVPAT